MNTNASHEARPVILITGIGQRAGYYLAEHYLQQGWLVIGTYRSERERLSSLRDQGALLFQADYQDEAATEQQVADIAAHLQHNALSLRAIIHNASDWEAENPAQTDAGILQRMMNIHARVPYLMNQALRPFFQQSFPQQGDIIHITDYVAATGSAKHMAYAASKAAVENLTLSMAKLWAPDIKVNAIAPALLEFNEGDGEAYKEKALRKNLIPSVGSFALLAETIDFMMHNHYTTGRIVPLDGGRHLN